MDRIFKLPVGVALFAFLAIVGVLGMFAFSAAQPVGAQSPEPVEYAEGGEGTVATFTAMDPDEDDKVSWSLSGDDDGAEFDIDEDGMLTFKNPPDFEIPTDSDEDNTYELTVTATDEGEKTDTFDVVVKVTNMDEEGMVTWTIDHDGNGARTSRP